jgi:hypothetical protein
MKKVFSYIRKLLFILIFTFSSAIFIYKEFINLSLLINSQEITGKIEEVKYTHTRRRSHYCTVYFEYEIEGIKYENNVTFNWMIIDRINNSIVNEYRNGAQIIIAYDDYGNFQVKNRIKKEFIIYLIYLLMSIAFLSLGVYLFLLNFPEKKKVSIYIQNTNYKIKEIKKLENIPSHINMLKQNKIICFGIGSNKDFIEFSYNGKEFIERKSKNSKEEEIIINDESELEKIIKIKLNEIERKA